MDSFEHLIEILFDTIVFMTAVSFIIFTISIGYTSNEAFIDNIGQKASSRYSAATYSDVHPFISSTDVMSDILSTDSLINIQVEGADIDPDLLEKARNNESVAIQAVKSALIQARYYKVTSYDTNGFIHTINFIGG